MNVASLKEVLKSVFMGLNARGLQSVTMERFLSGVYQRQYVEDELNIIETLSITIISRISCLFRIERVLQSKKIRGQSILITEHEKESWFCAYNYATHQLDEINKGRQCSFIPEEKLLILGKHAFMRVED